MASGDLKEQPPRSIAKRPGGEQSRRGLSDRMHNGIEAATKPVLRKLLKHAIANGHVWPAFQPIVNIRTGAISSFEILARWSDPQAGDISPDIFIPRLEQHGLIAVLSEALLEQACRSAADWPGQFTLAFNISPFQLISEDLPCNLVEVIEKNLFPAGEGRA